MEAKLRDYGSSQRPGVLQNDSHCQILRRDTRHALSMKLILAILLASSTVALSEPNESWPANAPYNKVFDPWHAFLAAEGLAKGGAPDALRTLFLAAFVRLNQPFLGGEDLETMSIILREVLIAVGDRRFSRALGAQRPEIRAAVRDFLGDDKTPWIKKCPTTAKLLRDVPKIDWPMYQAIRNDMKLHPG